MTHGDGTDWNRLGEERDEALRKLAAVAALMDEHTSGHPEYPTISALELHAAIADRTRPASMTPVPTRGTGKEIVRLADPIREKLREVAEAEGVSKSDVMRRAIVRELGIEADHE